MPPRELDDRHALNVRKLIRARSSRAKYFDSNLFSDPAWDLLLELFSAELQQKHVSISALGMLARIPPTTVLRWTKVLMKEGLVYRRDDPLDGRRSFVRLSDAGYKTMVDYFDSLLLEGLAASGKSVTDIQQ